MFTCGTTLVGALMHAGWPIFRRMLLGGACDKKSGGALALQCLAAPGPRFSLGCQGNVMPLPHLVAWTICCRQVWSVRADVEFVLETIWTWRQWLPTLGKQRRTILKSVHRAKCHTPQSYCYNGCPTERPSFCLASVGLIFISPFTFCGVIPLWDLYTCVECFGLSSRTPRKTSIFSRISAPNHPSSPRTSWTSPWKKWPKVSAGGQSKLELDHESSPEWRFLGRFLIRQPAGKKRVIDNGRKSDHNLHTQMQEAISTVSVDFVAAVARTFCDRIQEPFGSWDVLFAMAVVSSTDDLPDTYRGLPVADEHLRFSNIASFVPEVEWHFTTMIGLAYGVFQPIPTAGHCYHTPLPHWLLRSVL